jgi:hypothetical protein
VARPGQPTSARTPGAEEPRTNTLAVVQYAVALRGTNDWHTRKPAYVPPNSTRMLGYDINTYDFKILQVENRPY